MSWGYERSKCPPSDWGKQFPVANGKRQSPIDIITGDVKLDKKLKPINLAWKNETASEIFCNGHSVQVTFKPGSTLTGAHLSSEYELLQFHIHWGSDIGQGAEHFINGESGDAEIHFVHWNKKYGSPEEAMKNGDGLAVVGAVIHERDDVEASQCPGKYLTRFFPKSFEMGKKYQISKEMELLELLPQDKDFFCYEGSLTTPPLLECVMWILLKQQLYISPSTMTKLRSLPCLHGGNLTNNYRPPQPTKNRVVRSNK